MAGTGSVFRAISAQPRYTVACNLSQAIRRVEHGNVQRRLTFVSAPATSALGAGGADGAASGGAASAGAGAGAAGFGVNVGVKPVADGLKANDEAFGLKENDACLAASVGAAAASCMTSSSQLSASSPILGIEEKD